MLPLIRIFCDDCRRPVVTSFTKKVFKPYFCGACSHQKSIYRKNPDENLRDLEREYRASPTEELRSALNTQRLRSGLPLEPPICRIFHPREIHSEGTYAIQSPFLENRIITTVPIGHDGWWGLHHTSFVSNLDYEWDKGVRRKVTPRVEPRVTDLGIHLALRGYDETSWVPPTRFQTLQAHLHVMYLMDIGRPDEIGNQHQWDMTTTHVCDYNYDLSNALCFVYEKGEVIETMLLRTLLLCQQCGAAASLSCEEHNLTLCAEHVVPCSEADCDSLECPQCAPVCDQCKKPDCSYHLRETVCGKEVCTRPDEHCWDFCAHCDERICKQDAIQVDGVWYCNSSPPCYEDSPYANAGD